MLYMLRYFVVLRLPIALNVTGHSRSLLTNHTAVFLTSTGLLFGMQRIHSNRLSKVNLFRTLPNWLKLSPRAPPLLGHVSSYVPSFTPRFQGSLPSPIGTFYTRWPLRGVIPNRRVPNVLFSYVVVRHLYRLFEMVF